MIELTFVACLVSVFLIGISSTFKSRRSREDYYLASSSVPPWLTAVSALATLNSGYMFIGMIGFTYVAGLHSIWLTVGWIIGDFVASLFVYRQIRISSGRTGEVSFPGMLARWHGEEFPWWRRTAAVITVLFLTSYAAAQIAAGGKAFLATLDLAPDTGALVTALMVLGYCTAGGIRASIWTDAMQFAIMLVSMALLCALAIDAAGGIGAAYDALVSIPGYLNPYPSNAILPGISGLLLFTIGWVFAGLSIVGQPHIMVRYMALESADRIRETRLWYYSLYLAFASLTTASGLLARLLLPDLGATDPELALPTMARTLLPATLTGLMLAGIFAATMSTVDSLVLSTSAAITNDLLPRRWENRWTIKGTTVVVIVSALMLAVSESPSVFSLVILSWSTLGAAFGPLLILYAMNRRTTEAWAIGIMVLGVSIALTWRYFGFHAYLYEGFPAIVGGLALAAFASAKNDVTARHSQPGRSADSRALD